jgi:nucleoside-triphosphatase THEP1/energy-coupling factor transporter transmembrane protein EcfT
MRIETGVGLMVAVAASFSSRIEIVVGAAALACLVAWFADRGAFRRVLRVGLVLGAVFVAAAAGAAVAWASGLDRGLTIGGTVLLRLVVLGTAAAVVARSVDAEQIHRATTTIGLERLGLVFGLALNTLPHLGDTASTVWIAHRVRSGSRWAALRRLPSLAEVLLAHTGRLADQAAAAAALRGHSALVRRSVPLKTGDRTVVITGSSGTGKTPLVESLARRLLEADRRIAGFVQPAIVTDGQKQGFRIRDLASGETGRLAHKVGRGKGDFGSPFEFFDEGFEVGRRALTDLDPGVIVLVDELGPVELRGGGHWPAVEDALRATEIAGLVVVVRRTLVPALVEALDAADVTVIDLEDGDDEPIERALTVLLEEPAASSSDE